MTSFIPIQSISRSYMDDPKIWSRKFRMFNFTSSFKFLKIIWVMKVRDEINLTKMLQKTIIVISFDNAQFTCCYNERKFTLSVAQTWSLKLFRFIIIFSFKWEKILMAARLQWKIKIRSPGFFDIWNKSNRLHCCRHIDLCAWNEVSIELDTFAPNVSIHHRFWEKNNRYNVLGQSFFLQLHHIS